MPEGEPTLTVKRQFWTAQAVLRPMQSTFHILLPCLSQSGGGTEGGGLAPRPEFHSAHAWAVADYYETDFNLDATPTKSPLPIDKGLFLLNFFQTLGVTFSRFTF